MNLQSLTNSMKVNRTIAGASLNVRKENCQALASRFTVNLQSGTILRAYE